MSSTLLKRLLSSTWASLTRNKLLSLATIAVVVLISFFLNILGSVHYLANYSIDSINRKVDLALELKEGVDLDAPIVEQVKRDLEQSGATVVKISKEQALQDLKQILPDLGNFLETYRQNPLPASLYITAPSLKTYEVITTIIEQPQYKQVVNFDQNENGFLNQKTRITKIVDISEAVKRFVFVLQIIFFIVAVVIIVNTLQIVVHHRREEISVMQLVGASKEFIAAPFLLEGIIYGVVGVVLGFVIYVSLIQLAYWNLSQVLPGTSLKSFITSLWQYYSHDLWLLFLQQISLFVLIGLLASTLALSRFVRLFSFSALFSSSPKAVNHDTENV